MLKFIQEGGLVTIEKVLKDLTNNRGKLSKFLEDNISELFSTPKVTKFYKIIKDVNFSNSNYMVKLIISWLAFISGDHNNCFKIMNTI